MVTPRSLSVLDCECKFVEGDRDPAVHLLPNREFKMPSPEVLDEGMPGDDYPGAAVLLQPTHRTQPRFQPAVISLDVDATFGEEFFDVAVGEAVAQVVGAGNLVHDVDVRFRVGAGGPR